MFPDIKYIYWIRDPRDCILGGHVTDDLADFGVRYPKTDDIMLRRGISWKYQYDIVKATPQPANWIEVRFEDFVLQQEETLRGWRNSWALTWPGSSSGATRSAAGRRTRA